MLDGGIIVTTHLRAAAGACALSIGLLVCNSSGAVAVADQTDPSGTPTETQSGSSTTDTTSKKTTFGFGGPMTRFGNQRVDENAEDGTTTVTTITTGTTAGTGNENAPTSTVEAQTNTSEDQPGSGTVAPATNEEKVEPTTPNVVLDTPQIIAPLVESLTPETLTQETISPTQPSNAPWATPLAADEPGGSGNSPAPSGTQAPSTPGSVAPKPAPVAPLAHFSNAFNALAQGLGAATLKLAGAPFSSTPITDVITAVQIMLTAITNAVAEVAQVPKDLLSMFGIPGAGGPRAPLFGAGGSPIHLSHAPANAHLVGHEVQLPQVAAPGAPLFGNVVQAADFGGVATVGLSHQLASGLEPAPASVSPATSSFLDNMVKSVLVPASLTALAAIAVPGIAGLLIVCIAGIRVGYRQAKAGLALKLSGIARFAGPGPMGVVRSGSMVALHSRTSRLTRPHGLRAARVKSEPAARRHLEKVA
ncbi:hypothetical protein AB4Z42_07495 [Mycobacterium sp. 2YAF39]|uniref:hypothetical protein n=1 Tax=Mycobacterium sp. 2YAF39 TaxID=3233033 RepID=UPI003F948B0F